MKAAYEKCPGCKGELTLKRKGHGWPFITHHCGNCGFGCGPASGEEDMEWLQDYNTSMMMRASGVPVDALRGKPPRGLYER